MASKEQIASLTEGYENELTLHEKEYFTKTAKKMTEALLEATDLLGGITWCLVHEKNGISLFRADSEANSPCNVHAVCKFIGEIDDVSDSMVTNTTEAYQKMMAMLSSDFIEGAVIHNIVEPNEENPYRYIGIKWVAFKSSSPFTKDRDFIILEYVDMIEDEEGHKVAFRIMESVDLPNNSLYAESSKYTRDIVPLMGTMYHTTKKNGELRMTYSCNFDKNGDLPAWAANSAIQSHVEKCINGTLKYIESYRQKKEAIVLPQQVIPMSEQDHCRICEKNFCVLRRRYNCLKCGEVICSNCSSLRNAHVPDVGERQLRVCTACVIQARRNSRTSSENKHSRNSPSRNNTVDISCSSNGANTPKTVYHKRRSYDDVLEPVRSRLMEHKIFSSGSDTDSVVVPKSSFPMRSFSDGFVMGKNTLLGGKRRGSPADLAISLEAFRHQQMRNDMQVDQFEPPENNQRSSSPTNSYQSPVHRLSTRETDMPCLEQPQPETSTRTTRMVRTQIKMAQNEASKSDLSTNNNMKVMLSAAMERAQSIIQAAQVANNIAQEARKLSASRMTTKDHPNVFCSNQLPNALHANTRSFDDLLNVSSLPGLSLY